MVFADAMAHRFACRSYLPDPIPSEIITEILSYGQLTPSSFGLEGWAFHVVEGKDRVALCHACCDQMMVTEAPVSIVLLARRGKFYDPDGPFVRRRYERFGDPTPLIEDFRGFYQELKRDGRLDEWSRSQCYLVAANMMTGAKCLGVDSCALEGYVGEQVLHLLGLSPSDWIVAMVIPFGYAAVAETPKTRAPLDELVI
ncbi:MAG: nitroreductase family protein [Sphaerochaeta sp.]|nr:nitroreductase family protein [Sphaerochaeta sp.]MCI2129229.1 nitroreductase family protein [Sphaerochaeta sp.]